MSARQPPILDQKGRLPSNIHTSEIKLTPCAKSTRMLLLAGIIHSLLVHTIFINAFSMPNDTPLFQNNTISSDTAAADVVCAGFQDPQCKLSVSYVVWFPIPWPGTALKGIKNSNRHQIMTKFDHASTISLQQINHLLSYPIHT